MIRPRTSSAPSPTAWPRHEPHPLLTPPVSITISVCICTYRRPHLLQRTLGGLLKQETNGRFTMTIVVADNDREQSAQSIVDAFRAATSLAITYRVEPRRNIALARNAAVESAEGDYIAFIDDDEFPTPGWLACLLDACETYHTDGALGPIRPCFEHRAPAWLIRSRLCERGEHPPGALLHWRQTTTANALLRRQVLRDLTPPFRPIFPNGGEDQDLFRRLAARGYRFVWSNDAVVHELIPPARCTRSYLIRKALLRGQNERFLLSARSITKSLVAVPVYALMLAPLLPAQSLFMRYLVRLMDHTGKLLGALGFKPLGDEYPSA
jgi:glycosyltransferase involved in cell wall biosynthesis